MAIEPQPGRQTPRWALRAGACVVVLPVSLAAMSAAGCQQNACNGQAFAPQPSTPIIHNVAVSQPLADTGNPWHLALDIDFEDRGGDLGSGMAFVHLYGSPQVSRSFALETFFRASEVALDARKDTVALYTMLPPDAYPDGTTVQMDIQLEDASKPDPEGLYSNCYRMNLDFHVTPITQAASKALTGLGAQLAPMRARVAAWLWGEAPAPADAGR